MHNGGNLLRPLRYKNIQILRNPKQHVSWLTVDADTVSNNYQTKLAHREYWTKHQITEIRLVTNWKQKSGPACQLLGIKASTAKLFCEAWRFPKTTCSSFHVHVYTIHSLITVYLYCFRVFRDMLSLGQKCFMSFRDELRPKESVFMSIMDHWSIFK